MKIISNPNEMKILSADLDETEIIDVLSDLKHRVFPRPFERLSKLRKKSGLVGVEIGVCGGEHALSLLQHFDIRKLYLVDPYEMYQEYDEGFLHYGLDQAPLSQAENSAHHLLRNYSDRICWIKDFSDNAVSKIDDDLDFIYIDGNHDHDYDYVKSDIHNYLPLLKNKGIRSIGGHDFYNGFQSEHDGVIKAVVEYYASNTAGTLRVELPDWWIEFDC